MSSLTGFFDILYLGVFIIFSAAFYSWFYSTTKPLPTLVEELAYAEHQFHSLLHIFSQRFIVVLEGEPVAHSYVVDQMLGEFAAAVVVFAKALCGSMDDRLSLVVEQIEGIVQGSYPMVFSYYLQCLDHDHMHFIWTGPDLQILPCIESFDAIMPLLTVGDLPSHQIYHPIATTDMPSAIPIGPPPEKRHD